MRYICLDFNTFQKNVNFCNNIIIIKWPLINMNYSYFSVNVESLPSYVPKHMHDKCRVKLNRRAQTFKMSIRSKGWDKHCETWVPEKLPSFPKPVSMRRKCGYCKVVPDPVHNSLTCPLRLQQSGRRGATKKPLMSLTNRTQGKQRIRELVDMFDNFCEVNNEDKKDVLAFEYRRALYNDGKPKSAKTFESFHQQPSQILVQPLSPRKTAGRVVVTGQSWNESRDNFTYMNQHGLPVYAGPSETDLYRWSVSPMNVSYQM